MIFISMKYFRPFELQNQYPDIKNYIRENTIQSVNSLYNHGDVILKGIFPQNERIFPLSNIAFIRPIANTSIRFILKVKKSPTDEFPRYFTSFNYFSELEQSILFNNPYFINISLLDTNIVEFDLSESINAFKNQMVTEEQRNVKIFKNNFLKIIDETSKDSKTKTYGSDPKGVIKENDTLTTENTGPIGRRLFQRRDNIQNGRRTDLPNSEFINNETNIPNRRINLLNENVNSDIAGRLLSQNEITNTLEVSNEIQATNGELIGRRNRIPLPEDEINPNGGEKPVSEIEKMIGEVIENPYLDLVDDELKIYVDYRDLCYYLSWCISSPTLDSVENNGVLTPEELWKFEFTNKTNDTEKQDTPTESTGDGVQLPTTGKYFEYDIIRLTIPATLDQSKMMFRNQAGQMQEIQTDKYGLVGRFCMEENSFSGNHYIYQKTQIGPCQQISSGGGTFGGGNPEQRGYGYSRDYDTRIGAGDFISQERDFRNIQE